MSLETYDPKDIEVIVGGLLIAGFAKEKVKVGRVTDGVSDEVGANGDVARVISNDKRGVITITLLQTSKSNAVLSGLYKADEYTGTGVIPVIIKDTRGNDLHIAPQAWVTKVPDAVYNDGVSTREWVIRVANIQNFVAGA